MNHSWFSEKLITLRRRRQLSQSGLANKLFVSRQSVSKWENGEAEPSIDKLISIAEIFNVSLDYLLLGTKTAKERLLEMSNISKQFSQSVLKNVNLSIYQNERIALLGSNGAGKTTLIKILVGLERADSGSIQLSLNPAHDINVMPQVDGLIDDLKVKELLQLKNTINGHPADINALMEQFKLSNLWNDYVETLSGGQKRRLSLVLSIMKPSQLLILDEPTVGMDLESVDLLWQQLDHIAGSIMMITHDFNQIDKFFSRVLLLKDGVIANDVSVDTIHSHNQTVEQWYRMNNGGLDND